MREKEFLESVIYNRKSDVYIWYVVASWACEVTLFLKQNRCLNSVLLCVRILVTFTSLSMLYNELANSFIHIYSIHFIF